VQFNSLSSCHLSNSEKDQKVQPNCDEIWWKLFVLCLHLHVSFGGAQINGNHETMNVAGDFRNVTPGGFKEAEAFADCCEEDYGGNWEAAFGEWYATSQEKKADQGFSFGNWLPIFNYLRVLPSCSSVSVYSLFFSCSFIFQHCFHKRRYRLHQCRAWFFHSFIHLCLWRMFLGPISCLRYAHKTQNFVASHMFYKQLKSSNSKFTPRQLSIIRTGNKTTTYIK
jgi:hypothetical protein